MPSVLLLNPPASTACFRDCYCSGRAGGAFFVHPLDLQIQSGILHQHGLPIQVLDCIAERMNRDQALQRIKSIKPDVILALIGQFSFDDDTAFFKALRLQQPSLRIFISGDIARFRGREVFERTGDLVEAILMNFCSPALAQYLHGAPPHPDLFFPGLPPAYSPPGRNAVLSIPCPAPDFTRQDLYHLPFFRSPRFYSLLTAFGCPYPCVYCNAHLVGTAARPIPEVIQEMHAAFQSGFRSIYFRDPTFLADRKRTHELFNEWRKNNINVEWMCFTRPELVTPEMAAEAAALNCRMMMLGVESYDAEWLKDMKKPLSMQTVEEAFRILREHRIMSAAELMVGMVNNLPSLAAHRTQLKQLIRRIRPDFIATSVFERRPGITADHPSFQRSEQQHAELLCLEAEINRWFYRRPSIWLRQLSRMRSAAQIKLCLRTALSGRAGTSPYKKDKK